MVLISSTLKALRDHHFCPPSTEHAGRVEGKFVWPSNSELRRWCDQGCVRVDGQKVDWTTDINEATTLQFFRGSPSQCTMPFPVGLVKHANYSLPDGSHMP